MKNYYQSFLLIVAMCGAMCAATSLNAAVRYVKADAAGGDGLSWATAMATIDEAIDASSAGDEVWIAAGEYRPVRIADTRVANSQCFMIKDGVSLYGGFAGTEASRAERVLCPGGEPWEYVNETVLNGDDDVPDVWVREIAAATTYRNTWVKEASQIPGSQNNATHVLYQPEVIANHTVIDGLTIRGGNANNYRVKASGGGIYALGNVSVNACRIYENSCYLRNEANINSMGGGIYLNGAGSASVTNCHFSRNYAFASYTNGIGGGLYAQNARVEGCVFDNCVGEDGGGAVYQSGGSLRNCRISSSYASAGGGLYTTGVISSDDTVLATATADNVEVTDCQALNGGGIRVGTGSTLTHARVWGCKADATEFGETAGGSGGGIFLLGGRAQGCVVFNNMAFNGAGICIREGSAVNCTVQRNANREADTSKSNIAEWPGTGAMAGVVNCIGNPDADAANFVNPSSFVGLPADEAAAASLAVADWSLVAGSEFIDSGTEPSGSMESTDMAGNPRVAGNGIDVGAYEYAAAPVPEAILAFDGSRSSVIIGFRTADDVMKFQVGESVYSVSVTPNADKTVELPLEDGTEVMMLTNGLSRLNISGQGLTAIDLSGARSLTMLQVPGNSLSTLSVAGAASLTGIYADGNRLTTLDIDGCTALRVISAPDNRLSGTLDLSALTALSSVDVDNNALDALILPVQSRLIEVDCQNNNLTAIDLSGRTGLRDINVSGNRIAALDLAGLSALEDLYAGENEITAVTGLADCRSLETLNLSHNKLASINLTAVPSLTGLYLYNNDLTELDLTASTALSWINLNNNRIGTLDLSAVATLRLLHACDNELAELRLPAAPYCSQLTVGGNRLTSLDLSSLTSLYWLKADHNQLTAIDVTHAPYLSLLECGDNALTTLDVARNSYLRRIAAENNRLAALDISANPEICSITLQGNEMDGSALNAIISSLPDISGQEPVEGSEWISILNISSMPGTPAADVPAARAKGWDVIADGWSGVAATLAGKQVRSVRFYSSAGELLPCRPASGFYIEKTDYTDGSTSSRKLF